MTTLGIFTVKVFYLHDGRYFTYGGFGDYLAEIRKYFDKVVLVAHVRRSAPPPGCYAVPGGNLEIVPLPVVSSELGALVTIPIVFWRSLGAISKMDVVHARLPDYTGIVGAVVARMYGVACFHQIIDDWQVLARTIPLTSKFGLGALLRAHLLVYDWFERRVCRGQMVFAQGDSCYAKHGKSSDCELVLSSAHHVGDVVAPRPRFERAPYTILNVGRLNSVKNQALLLQALARLNENADDWRLVVVGSGPQEAELRLMAKKLNLEQWVTFAGQLAHGVELWKPYDAADVFVLSSVSEGTPKVLLEAMARGTPVVASAVSGVPTAVKHEKRGLLFASGDVDGLVSALGRMRDDTRLRTGCQLRAVEFAREQTVEAATRRMLDKVFVRWPKFALKVSPQ
ncbi:MAG: glycosyltransferase [Proteobacteria bacterium]|nr:glycosyltransferase [Pseudomonadota bacterium]